MKTFILATSKKNSPQAAFPASKAGIITLRVTWIYSIERIKLDLSKPYLAGSVVSTSEVWTTEKGECDYTPQISKYDYSGDSLRFTLTYDKDDYSEAMLGLDIDWGQADYEVNLATREVTVHWKSEKYKTDMPLTVHGEVIMGDEEREMQRILVSRNRRNQSEFRKQVAMEGVYCALTEEELESALEAVHLVGVEDGGPDVPENGMFLRVDLHRLFDAGCFTIDNDGMVRIPDPAGTSQHKWLTPYYADLLKGAQLRDVVLKRVGVYLKRRNDMAE
jgi:hypothetical protein